MFKFLQDDPAYENTFTSTFLSKKIVATCKEVGLSDGAAQASRSPTLMEELLLQKQSQTVTQRIDHRSRRCIRKCTYACKYIIGAWARTRISYCKQFVVSTMNNFMVLSDNEIFGFTLGRVKLNFNVCVNECGIIKITND